MFPRRYCYCITNETNDLTDFTAVLLDVMGNSTSYLQELFKSSSILSVSQKNNSDCIYICVMAGKSAQPTTTKATQISITTTTAFTKVTITEKPGCPWTPGLAQMDEWKDNSITGSSSTTVSAQKLQPCVLELCKFFSQCLCRSYSYKTHMKRYCADSHVWYEKHTFEVCRRVRRVSFSKNLKQRCLARMCNKL
ncbi:hypothetical protein DPEC_G00057770 [Dallia pectoralis]|uniref:Uncharacterized protein n=1 Tax=Dallia pectoralis TaxID=75939 RepID=A0ACC2H6L1_DALPE|nr:hypothetical protein DPEC_G00057770 [Dallia pectoralis]